LTNEALASATLWLSRLLGSGDAFGFAEAYADQNERDYAVFSDAIGSGRIAGRN
jgi:hypothetical protein